MGFSSSTINEAYKGDPKKSKQKVSKSSMPPLAAVIDMASMEDNADA